MPDLCVRDNNEWKSCPARRFPLTVFWENQTLFCLIFFHRPLKFKYPTSPIHYSVVGYYQICLYLVLKKMAKRVFFSRKQNIGSLKCCIPRFCTAMYCATGDQRSNLFKLKIAAAGPKILFTACSGLVSSETGFDLNHRSLACFTNHHHHGRCHSF